MYVKKKKKLACMGFRKNEAGYTFASLLLTLVIVLLMMPVFSLLLQIIRFEPDHSHVDALQFFYYLNEEALIAKTVEIDPEKNTIRFRREPENTDSMDRAVKYEQVKNYIRRNKKNGHEIYLRQIDTFRVTSVSYGFQVKVVMENGEEYEKTITHNTTKE